MSSTRLIPFGGAWRSAGTVTIRGVGYALTFNRGTGLGPTLSLTAAEGPYGGTVYTAFLDCCGCGYATFVVPWQLCDGPRPSDDPCDNMGRITVRYSSCLTTCATGDIVTVNPPTLVLSPYSVFGTLAAATAGSPVTATEIYFCAPVVGGRKYRINFSAYLTDVVPGDSGACVLIQEAPGGCGAVGGEATVVEFCGEQSNTGSCVSYTALNASGHICVRFRNENVDSGMTYYFQIDDNSLNNFEC